MKTSSSVLLLGVVDIPSRALVKTADGEDCFIFAVHARPIGRKTDDEFAVHTYGAFARRCFDALVDGASVFVEGETRPDDHRLCVNARAIHVIERSL